MACFPSNNLLLILNNLSFVTCDVFMFVNSHIDEFCCMKRRVFNSDAGYTARDIMWLKGITGNSQFKYMRLRQIEPKPNEVFIENFF